MDSRFAGKNVKRNKCVINGFTLVSCRSTAKSNHSHKNTTTTITKNRYDTLQNLEVSPIILPVDSGGNSVESSHKKNSTKNNGKSQKKYAKSGNDPNPSGDIWDQKSLNLDTLFQSGIGNNFNIGIWNAESVRQKENSIKNISLTMTWIYLLCLNPGFTRMNCLIQLMSFHVLKASSCTSFHALTEKIHPVGVCSVFTGAILKLKNCPQSL